MWVQTRIRLLHSRSRNDKRGNLGNLMKTACSCKREEMRIRENSALHSASLKQPFRMPDEPIAGPIQGQFPLATHACRRSLAPASYRPFSISTFHNPRTSPIRKPVARSCGYLCPIASAVAVAISRPGVPWHWRHNGFESTIGA
jgi:hypothetical protein